MSAGVSSRPAEAPSFETLWQRAVAEWPATVDLPVRDVRGFHPSATIVEGLTDLNDRLCARWNGYPEEIFMATMHWRIATVLHKALATKRSPVDVGTLDRIAVRDLFEQDLRRFVRRRHTWSGQDVAAARSYLRASRVA